MAKRIVFISLMVLIMLLLYSDSYRISGPYLSFKANLKEQTIQLYWKDDKGRQIRSLGALDNYLKSRKQELPFAMNAGMFDPNFNPVGLFVEEGIVVKQINRSKGKGEGNFYMQPNGFFYIDSKSNPGISLTNEYNKYIPLCHATQSGPMLVIDRKTNKVFEKNAQSRYIRNGVGIKKDNTLIFILSGRKVNFYDFADFFLKEGCVRALYLDGFVSRALYPGKNQLDYGGDFGVMVGVVKKKEVE